MAYQDSNASAKTYNLADHTSFVDVRGEVGVTLTVGTPSVTVLEVDSTGNVRKCTGATVPTAGDAGYAQGCQFILTTGNTASRTIYVNEGSATSAAFNAIPSTVSVATALAASGGAAINPALGTVFTVTPTASETITASSAPAGAVVYLVVTTSGVTSYTLTFGTNIKSTGTLATGTTSGATFTITFIGNGTNLNEVARTTAM